MLEAGELDMVIEFGPGTRLYDYGKPYGFERHLQEYGNGTNRLRTDRLAQVGALKAGDVLANGAHVWSDPREGGNGSVLLHLDIGGGWFGTWHPIPARIPIALKTSEKKEKEAQVIKEGDILATGEKINSVSVDNSNGFTTFELAEGKYITRIEVPTCIPVAILSPKDDAPKALWEYHKKP